MVQVSVGCGVVPLDACTLLSQGLFQYGVVGFGRPTSSGSSPALGIFQNPPVFLLILKNIDAWGFMLGWAAWGSAPPAIFPLSQWHGDMPSLQTPLPQGGHGPLSVYSLCHRERCSISPDCKKCRGDYSLANAPVPSGSDTSLPISGFGGVSYELQFHFQVFIKVIDWKSIVLWVRDSDIVTELKNKIQSVTGIPAQQQRLIF